MTTTTLPHWDMTVVYPSLDAPEFAAGFADVTSQIEQLETAFQQHDIGKHESVLMDKHTIETFEQITRQYNDVLTSTRTLQAYISSFVATNTRNATAQAHLSELQAHLVRLSKLGTQYTAWIGSLNVEMLVTCSELARDHAFMLRKTKQQAQHLMSAAEESLAADLAPSSGVAWTKLHMNVSSQLSVAVEQADGSVETLPMSAVRNLAFDADRDTRRRAYEAELAGWESVSVPLAAALNSIKGEVNTLTQRRGWDSALDVSLFANTIDRTTLDAMLHAAREAFPDLRRYLQAKARALGTTKLAWYDLFAPIGGSTMQLEYPDATRFIEQQFATYSPRLSEFAARAFNTGWIDAEPRSGKRDGAFCMWLRGDESRVFANFKPAFGGMSTLAHELGHAYHNLNLADRTMLQRSTPMTLAETASTFCETIVRQAAMEQAEENQQLAILEATLQGACQIVVDISSRFQFERNIFERRQQRELSVAEFNELMLEAQRDTYGDGLDTDVLHPYMWAVKGHYYSPALSFYNYPYMFGLLFGLGLYARYQADADTFRTGYDELLSQTGMDDAATLAARFGIDIRTPDFWRSSLDVIRRDIDRFVDLIDGSKESRTA